MNAVGYIQSVWQVLKSCVCYRQQLTQSIVITVIKL
jgi:hypothetical protein